MNSGEHSQAKTTAWALAGVLLLHLLLFRDSSGILLAAVILLLAGTLLRGWQIFAPRWLGNTLLAAGIAVVLLTRVRFHPVDGIGEMGAVIGAALLLRPLNPTRGLWVLFSILLAVFALIIQGAVGVGIVWILMDAAALMILAEQVHRPPEAATSLLTSLIRSLRVVVPVGTVVTLIFWIFPSISPQSASPVAGFSGSEMMDPGDISELNSSARVALVATFSKDQPIPPAEELYWRGQVLEENEGLRWRRTNGRWGKPTSVKDLEPTDSESAWRYSQELPSNRGGILPVLERAQSLDATRYGQKVVVFDLGGTVLNAVGTGALKLDVQSSPERVSDAPDGKLDLAVPSKTAASPVMRALVEKLISPTQTTTENLANIAQYLRNSNFAYTLRPGRIPFGDVPDFLERRRRGFCEHYAAASANLLRLGGIPARIVTGYRGGEWNPWLRTITVRDSDAHAWVEAWDPLYQHWLRFDPTSFVAPELTSQLKRDFDSAHWPWYRFALSYAGTLVTTGTARLSQFFETLSDTGALDYLLPTLFGVFLLLFAGQLAENYRRRSKAPLDRISRLLANLEAKAARTHRGRHPGETPLAWLNRLGEESHDDPETQTLRRFATEYEAAVYGGKLDSEMPALRLTAARLGKIWRSIAKSKTADSSVNRIRQKP